MHKKKEKQFVDTIWFVVSLLAVGALSLLAINGAFLK
jgi:hypothetical protein